MFNATTTGDAAIEKLRRVAVQATTALAVLIWTASLICTFRYVMITLQEPSARNILTVAFAATTVALFAHCLFVKANTGGKE